MGQCPGIPDRVSKEQVLALGAAVRKHMESTEKAEGKSGAYYFVEVLSPSTAKNDKGYKKELYEKCGVKEYWIVDPVMRSIETYLLTDGKYILDEFYALPPDAFGITDKEREETKKEIRVSLYDEFRIPLEEIFYNLF